MVRTVSSTALSSAPNILLLSYLSRPLRRFSMFSAKCLEEKISCWLEGSDIGGGGRIGDILFTLSNQNGT